MAEERIQKIMAEQGLCSRRAAEQIIACLLYTSPLYYLNNIVWELLGKGTGYIDKIAYSIYYAGLGTVV